ncbi:MAG TPA: hypothetical protein VMW01_16330 [Williamwhitmania sp.]|jgi:hypothetical protein|nr:hypothetical protein [Williamwhitmania sp.]
MKNANIFLVILFSFHFYSCNEHENEFNLIDPSISQIEMEAEGGKIEISFTNPNWTIAGIVNQNSNANINGNCYTLDSVLVRENDILKLDSLGRLDALWGDKGFSIVRNSYSLLNIFVKENATGKDFGFTIILKSGNETKEILVSQKKSQGYTFKKIEYNIDKYDGDSIFIKKGSDYEFINISSAQEFTLEPFKGNNIVKTSFFKSDEENAFAWTASDSVLVEIPSGIWDNKLYFNGEESVYTNNPLISESNYSSFTKTVIIPQGNSEFSVDIQYRERIVSYSLYLTNNRTKNEKVINGKWIEIAPTGDYAINWKN